MESFEDIKRKRQVHPLLKKTLNYDIQFSKKFIDVALKITVLRTLRTNATVLEVSCHGLVWLAGWLSFIWLFSDKDFFQLQVNMLIALILDIVVIAVIKAIVRRRRPIPMNKYLTAGPDKYSFPSGHASRAVLVAFILIFLYQVPIIFYPPLVAWVTAVSLSRVLAERHYILDVIGGAGIGLIEGFLIGIMWLSQSTSASILSSLSDEKRDGGEYHV